jgi:hypothetical protein
LSAPKHIIKRQVIEVEVPSVESAWNIQNRVSELYKYELLRILEEVFNSIAKPGEVLRIDKLEIDLGNIKADALEEEISTKLKEKVKEKLEELMHNTVSKSEQANAPNETEASVRNVRYTKSDLLLHFLKTGTAPWWYNKENFGTMSAVAKEIFTERPQWVKNKLKPLLSYSDIRRRFIHHLDDQLMQEFLMVFESEIAKVSFEAFKPLSENVERTKTGSITKNIFRPLFWEAVVMKTVFSKEEQLVNLFSREVISEAVVTMLSEKKSAAIENFVREVDIEKLIEEKIAEKITVGKKEKEIAAKELKRKKLEQKNKRKIAAWKKKNKSGEISSEELQKLINESENDLLKEINLHNNDAREIESEENELSENESRETSDESSSPEEKKSNRQKRILLAKAKLKKLLEQKRKFAKERQVEVDSEIAIENRKISQFEKGENENDELNEESDEEIISEKHKTEKEITDEMVFGTDQKIETEKREDELISDKRKTEKEEDEIISDKRKTEKEQEEIITTKSKIEKENEKIISAKKKLEEEEAKIIEAKIKLAKETELIAKQKEKEEEFNYEISEEDLTDFTVDNGGLVLLWPYLNPFFTELGLLKDKEFVNETASSRAVHLLQYLASSGIEYEEHDLVFNKILCGLDVTEPIDMQFEITEQEREESENLLKAVIANWKAIGKTSVDGFRVTFLQKEGALKKNDQGWNLFIERKTVDMLLDRLPWGISIIRLSWCKETIYVEW